MRDLGITLCRAGVDLWMIVDVDKLELRAMTGDELSAGERYYDYILTHVNDLVLAIHRTEQVT